MDAHSEVEAKFKADGLYVSQVQELVDDLANGGNYVANGGYYPVTYTRVEGTDSFYRVGEGSVRLRKDRILGGKKYGVVRYTNKDKIGGFIEIPKEHDFKCCLTVKQRTSTRNLLNRKEVDLHIHHNVDTDDVAGLFGLLGGKFEFVIRKQYYVWMLKRGPEEICLALYDVCDAVCENERRFLEVEIEKHSEISQKDGLTLLNYWIDMVQGRFQLEKPVNKSLYEMYKP